MKPVTKKILIVACVILLSAISLAILTPQRSRAQQQLVGNTYSKVTLYSNDGKVIGTWTAVGLGQMEGNTFTFTVYRGVSVAHEWQVRINGTFTVEQTAP